MKIGTPSEVVLRVHRPWTRDFEDVEGRTQLHRDRSKLLHGMVDALALEVRSWGETDESYPREWVEIAIAVTSATVAAAVGEVVKAWLDRGKALDVEIARPDGTTFSVRGMTQDERAQLGRLLWQKPRKRAGKPAGPSRT
jgi:hypothetical protein